MYLFQTYFKGCGGYFDTSNGSIQYPESNTTSTYQSNMNCAWMIEVNPSQVINISFVWIDIEKSLTCSSDYVKVNYFYFILYFILFFLNFYLIIKLFRLETFKMMTERCWVNFVEIHYL